MLGTNKFVLMTIVGLVALCSFAIASPDSHQYVADCSGVASCAGYVAVDCSAPEVATCSGTVVSSAAVHHHHRTPIVGSRQYRKHHDGWYAGKAVGAVAHRRQAAKESGAWYAGKILTSPIRAIRCANGQCHKH